jgi:hypothetical protein
LTGDYPFEIVKVENLISNGPKTRGSDTREISLVFFRDEKFTEQIANVRDTLINHESCDWKFSVLAKCVHFDVLDGQDFDVDDDWLGYRGWAHCAPEPDKKDKTKSWNRVRVYLCDRKPIAPRAIPTSDDADRAAFGKPTTTASTDDDDCPF